MARIAALELLDRSHLVEYSNIGTKETVLSEVQIVPLSF